MTSRLARARATAILAALIGLAVAVALIGYFNVGAVLAAMRPIGLVGFAAVIGAQLCLFIPLGLAWWLVAPDERLSLAPVFAWGRLMREAASDVLPFSQLGGLAIAARAAVLGGATAPAALGSSVVDVTVEMAAQLIYTLFGIALLAHRIGFAAAANPLLPSLLAGLVVATALVGLLIAGQGRALNLVAALLHRLAPSAGQHASAVTVVVNAAYRRPSRLWAGLGLHVFSWFAAAGGTWLILAFIGRPLPFSSVAAIESLMFAIRNAAFFAPSGLGVQEGAYALLGPLFGLPVEAALALSLLKRARDITIGVPMLLSWQLMESRRRLREA
jgi:glycosyltransferase 2 family protein